MVGSFLKQRDVFGHQVVFTIKGGNGTEQTSKCGGLMTILIYLFIFTYVTIKGQKMMKGSLDNITSSEELTDFEALQKVFMTNTKPMFNVISAHDMDFLQYLQIGFMHFDGYTNEVTFSNARQCNQTDVESYGMPNALQEDLDELKKFNFKGEYLCFDDVDKMFVASRFLRPNQSEIHAFVSYNELFMAASPEVKADIEVKISESYFAFNMITQVLDFDLNPPLKYMKFFEFYV